MKKVLPYFLLLIYSTIMLKPVMPYIADGVAHILFFKDHMATLHAHHGKYHVHAEIQEATKNDSSEKNTAVLKKETSGNEHISTKLNVSGIQKDIFLYYVEASENPESPCLTYNYPPPKA